MIRLGLRLTLGGGRDAVTRLAVIAAAVAIGVGLLLTTLAGINAVNAQNARYAWLETGYAPDSFTTNASTPDPLWWLLRADYFDGETIGRVDVAATGPDALVPPGIAELPGPGEFYASPALSALLATTPADQLGDRFGGTQVGTIGPEALPAPDSLIIILGHHVDELANAPGADKVASISTTSPSSCGNDCAPVVGINERGITLVLSVVAAALLFPVLIFIGSATRLSAARREQRFAAMRLVGATPRQVSVISAVESSVAAVIGVTAGFALFAAFRPVVAAIPFTGETFYPGDLSLSPVHVLVVAIGVPVAAAVAARIALRRVQISPLGVNRRATPRPPRAWRLIPLVAGIAELGYFAFAGRPTTSAGQQAAYLPGLLLIMAGLVMAGPWLTMAGARLMARRTGRPAVLIAGRRLSDNPQAGFRAISGLILALFVASGAVGVITTIVAYGGASEPGAADGGTMVQRLDDPLAAPSITDTTVDALESIPGVEGVTVMHRSPDAAPDGRPPPGVVTCAQLAATPALGRCPAGVDTATVRPSFGGGLIRTSSSMADAVWPPADVSIADLQRLPVEMLAVGTDGSTAAIEAVRTVLELAHPDVVAPSTIGEISSNSSRDIAQYQQLANVVILASLPIAGCSLAVSVAAGLSDRQRPFSLLRLTGVPLTMLRRVVALESVVPLLLTAVVAAGSGFLAAQLFLRAQLDQTLQPPGAGYYVIVAAGLAGSLAVIASTLPLLDRITGPETARND